MYFSADHWVRVTLEEQIFLDVKFLTLIGMSWGGYFYILVLLDQILTAAFLSKIIVALREVKKDINRINLIPFWAYL